MSGMLGKKLRWGGKQRLQSKAELFPHVIDRHGLACRTLTSRGTAFFLRQLRELYVWGIFAPNKGEHRRHLAMGRMHVRFKF